MDPYRSLVLALFLGPRRCYASPMIQAIVRTSTDPNIAGIAALIADPVRAAMLLALFGGGELSASELALRAGSSRQAASGHLSKLVAGGLLVSTTVGRQHLFRIASADIASAIEALGEIARPVPIVTLSQSTTAQRIQEACVCYDHLAGRLGVALTDHFVDLGSLTIRDRLFDVPRHGEETFQKLGIDVGRERANLGKRRDLARACIDWTLRRPHLAGPLGASILESFLASGWVVRNTRDRALRVTPEGRGELERRFQILL